MKTNAASDAQTVNRAGSEWLRLAGTGPGWGLLGRCGPARLSWEVLTLLGGTHIRISQFHLAGLRCRMKFGMRTILPQLKRDLALPALKQGSKGSMACPPGQC